MIRGACLGLAAVVLLAGLVVPAAGPTSEPPAATRAPLVGAAPPSPEVAPSDGANWTTYLFDAGRSGANLLERTISPANVSGLVQRWSLPENGSDFSAPIVVGGLLYYGSWNGYEYAVNVTNGTVLWSDFLGTDPCGYSPMGISSTPAYLNGTIYLGGGDGYWYALNATSGAVEWDYFFGAPPTVNNYDWASALVYRNSLYVGVSSCFDNPLIRGALYELNLTGPHTPSHIFWTVPANETGDSIWTSPTLDAPNNTIWVSTGNENTGYPPYANAIIALNATTLNVTGSWQVPNEAGKDSDFGSTPTLCETAAGVPMVVATDKNGIAYGLVRSNVSSNGSWGPVWTLGTAGGFSSGAFEGGTLYLAGDALYAVDPANGSVRWQNDNISGVYAALTWANGLIYVGAGSTVYAVDATNGTILWNATVPGGGSIVAETVVVNGQVYVPSGDYATEGDLVAYTLPFGASASATPTTGTVPLTVQFTAAGTGGLFPYHYRWAFGDGGFGTGPTPTHVYAEVEPYTVTLWVNDSSGASLERTLNITGQAPVPDPDLRAHITVSTRVGVAPLLVNFTGFETNGTNAPFTYRWTFGSGFTAIGPNASFVYREAGNFTADLEVVDDAGYAANASVTVDVAPAIGANPAERLVNETSTCGASSGPIQLEVSANASGGFPPYTYLWSLSDGQRGTGASIFLSEGVTVVANLTVTDAQGNVFHLTFTVRPIVEGTSSQGPCPVALWSDPAFLVALTLTGVGAVALVAGAVWARRRRGKPAAPESSGAPR